MLKPIRIIDREFNLLGEIDDYESLIWTRRWYKAGEFELHININKQNTNTLQKENIVLFEGSKAGIIMHRELNVDEKGKGGETLIIRGSSLSSLVGRRITIPPEGQAYDVVDGNAESVIKHYVDVNCVNPVDIDRKIPNLVIATNQNRGVSLKYQSRLKQLDEELEKISMASGLGWDIEIDVENKQFIFIVKEGKNLISGQEENNPVIFSIDFDNIKGQTYIDSDLNYRNQAYVGGQGEGVERTIVEVGEELQGLDRHEVFIDARDIENDLDLPARGQQKLLEMSKLQSFESEILTKGTFEYQKDWDLGDVVTVVNPEWGITMETRIVEVKEIYEPSGFKLEATFGNTIPTLIEKIKQEIDMPLIEKGERISSWEDIPDKPTEYPPSSHEHSEYLRNDGGRISAIYSNGKRFYNILNYLYTSRATSGFKIKTNIPEKSTKMVTLKFWGYNYGGSTPVDMSIVFYTYSSGIINLGACSASEFKPPITLAVENGKIVVFIEGNLYFFNFALDAYVHTNTDESFFEGWSVVVDEEISSNATEIKTVPYRE